MSTKLERELMAAGRAYADLVDKYLRQLVTDKTVREARARLIAARDAVEYQKIDYSIRESLEYLENFFPDAIVGEVSRVLRGSSPKPSWIPEWR